MATLRAEILALQSHRNTLRPINRLPPEIFSTIFQLVKDDITEAERVSWIKVTHVCRYWREIALDHASLWSNISFIHPELAKVMHIRSKISPL
ncbi:hypothetical protein FA13DRAFT_1640179, partial [Coprinellus micaceus]